MKQIEVLLWDQDGVIVDTEPLFFEATCSALAPFDIELSRAHWASCQVRGRRLEEVVPAERTPDLDFVEIRRVRDDLYEDSIGSSDVFVEGAEDLLEELSSVYRLALVTNSLRRFVDLIHRDSNTLRLFEHIVCGSPSRKGKPHPEPYLRALELMAVAPQAAIAIEDSPQGLQAATSAGIRCLVVHNEFMQGSDFSKAEAVLPSIHAIREHLSS